MAEKKEFTKHKNAAYSLTVDGIIIQLIEPSRHVLKIATDKMIQTTGGVNMASAGEIIFNSCIIDDENAKKIKSDDVLLNSAFIACFGLIEIKEATIAKI